MKYDPEKHHPRSIRLKGYDYSQPGAYFVTIRVQNGQFLFGAVVDDTMYLNDIGLMVQGEWKQLPQRFSIELDVYVVMPNHFHAIVVVTDNNVGASLVDAPDRAGTRPAPTNASNRVGTRLAPTEALGDMIGAFKSITTNEYISGVDEFSWPRFNKRFWQRNYHEHIIRNEEELNRIREYILTNPLRWTLDRENPEREGEDEFDRWLFPDK